MDECISLDEYNFKSVHDILAEFYIGRRILELEAIVNERYGLDLAIMSNYMNMFSGLDFNYKFTSFDISSDIDKFIGYIKDIEELKFKFRPISTYDDYFDLKKCEIMIYECKTFISRLMNLSIRLFNKTIEVPLIYCLP